MVDLLHEAELGVWKRLFIHLIRLLDAFTRPSGPTLAAELDFRWEFYNLVGLAAIDSSLPDIDPPQPLDGIPSVNSL